MSDLRKIKSLVMRERLEGQRSLMWMSWLVSLIKEEGSRRLE